MTENSYPDAPSERTGKSVSYSSKFQRHHEGQVVSGLPSSPQAWMAMLNVDFTDEEFDYLKKNLKWGTFGIDGTSPCKFIPLGEMDADHIINVLITQTVDTVMTVVMLKVLKEKLTNASN